MQGRRSSYDHVSLSTTNKLPISNIYYNIMRKLHKYSDSPSSSTLLHANFPDLTNTHVLKLRCRNKIKEFFVLFKANSPPVSVGKKCPIFSDIHIKNHIFHYPSLNCNLLVVSTSRSLLKKKRTYKKPIIT
eukprot:TRINITY_DN5601_c0_g2_i1.p1 TRINITY_DN5601_c0_g2~~TRINITY_DN5601_c0_g2_i1.p1  ORF type:complete len:131 (-),score=10.92 TRINITY_DN5601_c0_g2_i1:42-434(-)